MSVSDKLLRLNALRKNILAETEEKGIDISGATFENIHELWPNISGGSGDLQLQEKDVVPSDEDVSITPDAGHALSAVNIASALGLQPHNIRKGRTIFGITGTAEIEVTSEVPPDIPVQPEDAEVEYETEFEETPPEDMMVLQDDNGNITYGYFMSEQEGMSVYNGMVLPELPEWDEEKYPYARIAVGESGNLYLSCSPVPARYGTFTSSGTTYTTTYIYVSAGTRQTRLICDYENGVWGSFRTTVTDRENNTSGLRIRDNNGTIWANHDIENRDAGGIYLAASDPTPYEGFTITSYDPVTTNFTAIGWRRLSYHTTGPNAGTWTDDDFMSKESAGWNYLKNIVSCTREKLYYKGVEVWPHNLVTYPMIAEKHTWYKGTTLENTITEINIVDRYVSNGNEKESWAADIENSGSIMCYVNDTVLTIAGNGTGRILANPNSSDMFRGRSSYANEFSKVVAINGFEIVDTSMVTSMWCMFYSCSSLISLDLSHFDTHAVTDMSSMFHGCRALVSLNISGFDTSSVRTMYSMFGSCQALINLDLSYLNTSSVTSMSNMFVNCAALVSLNLTSFDTSSVGSMQDMFDGCSSLTSLDLTSFNTKKCSNMYDMFGRCTNLSVIYVGSDWSTSAAGNPSMFAGCGVSTVTRI